MRMRRVLLLLVKPSPLKAQLRAPLVATEQPSADSPAASPPPPLFDGTVEPAAALVDLLAGLDPQHDRLVCFGPEPIRQHLIPQLIREELSIPSSLLNYYDLSKINTVIDCSSDQFDDEARQLSSCLQSLSEGLSSSSYFVSVSLRFLVYR
ncbi:hypothetical protein Q1695_009533 [Nippostrongylus brasiliensis]|nr:hypothetical protein Q1695_009533 [Nippostrongylus brasiliensis]